MATPLIQDYAEKFQQISPNTLFSKLPEHERSFIQNLAFSLRFTQQELREICLIGNDLQMWKEAGIEQSWPASPANKKAQFALLRTHYQTVQSSLKQYVNFTKKDKPKTLKPTLVTQVKGELGLGVCPVASEKTRCCNLLTLDAVERCGFDCSYCSIQSFYHQNEVRFDEDFAGKLSKLVLDPEKTYHIGTGQSSDSLMWGNHNGNLAALSDFAARHPNVILEFKTKSNNIGWLLKNDYPENIICTWSLNPQEIIDHEEHNTASLAARISSARRIVDKGRLVGFHFHPMIWFEGAQSAYSDIAQSLMQQFEAAQIAMISMGSLTYTKAVMRTIRKRDFKSKILQMPLQQVAGKFSYPDEIKIQLFKSLYTALEDWQQQVFFYLCMESTELWAPVFGAAAYADNHQLERAMKTAYLAKIQTLE